jgi:hypothetical protein
MEKYLKNGSVDHGIPSVWQGRNYGIGPTDLFLKQSVD